MEDENKHNRLCDKSKEELVAIILRKDDVHNRLYRTNKFLKRKVEELELKVQELMLKLELYEDYSQDLESGEL